MEDGKEVGRKVKAFTIFSPHKLYSSECVQADGNMQPPVVYKLIYAGGKYDNLHTSVICNHDQKYTSSVTSSYNSFTVSNEWGPILHNH